MADAIYVGRAGLPTASGGDGLTLYTDTWEQEGDEATVGLVVRGQSSVAATKALRDQLLGYGPHNTDEPVIPVVNTADSSRDGWYRVQSITQDNELTGRLGASNEAGGNLAYEFTAELLRVPGWKAPMFEVVCSGANRETAHAITEWSWVGAPYQSDATVAEVFTSRTAMSSADKAGPNNDTATLWFAPAGSKTALYDDTFMFALDSPSDYYRAGARIEVSIDSGSTWHAVTGRQLPFATLDATSRLVRLSNGFVRITPYSPITLEVYDASWESKTFKLGAAGSTATQLNLSNAPVILRNDPQAVSLRCWFGSSTASSPAIGYCDLTVRRGSWVVEGFANAMDANEQLGIFRSSNEAGSAVTGGIDASSADADGNKYQLRSPAAVTAETTKGGIYLTSAAQTFPFAIATDKFAGDNTTAPSTSGLYFAAMNHRQYLTSR